MYTIYWFLRVLLFLTFLIFSFSYSHFKQEGHLENSESYFLLILLTVFVFSFFANYFFELFWRISELEQEDPKFISFRKYEVGVFLTSYKFLKQFKSFCFSAIDYSFMICTTSMMCCILNILNIKEIFDCLKILILFLLISCLIAIRMRIVINFFSFFVNFSILSS